MDELEVLKDIIECADSWEPKACLIGNVMAGDIAVVARKAYSRAYAEGRNSLQGEGGNSSPLGPPTHVIFNTAV